jgi:DNA-binding IscR family transcriptional regulator
MTPRVISSSRDFISEPPIVIFSITMRAYHSSIVNSIFTIKFAAINFNSARRCVSSMRISTKCSIALQLLVVLEVFKDKKLTSGRLARSTGCNPVIVRNLIGNLKKAGIVDVQRGSGGTTLVAALEAVTIWDVYQAVDATPLDELIGIHPNPSPACPVGSKIRQLLEKPFSLIAASVQNTMSGYTLRQLLDDYSGLA